LNSLDPRFHGNDDNGLNRTFYESINTVFIKIKPPYFLSKYARIPLGSAGRMNGLPSPLGASGPEEPLARRGEGEFILSSPPP